MASRKPLITDQSREAWKTFFANQDNRGHSSRKIDGDEVEAYFNSAMDAARETVSAVDTNLFNDEAPDQVLEIGASTGVNCLALKERYPNARVVGVEPEREALKVAESMAADLVAGDRPEFILGIGEELPLPDNSFDLIVCSTVIEHVYDVEKVISEISRVLKYNGTLYLAAPNYIWPKEPHLQIWCIPMLGKGLMKLAAYMQGKRDEVDFLHHLQLVTPRRIEKAFRASGLSFVNFNEKKAKNVVSGDTEVKAYKRVGVFLTVLNRLGLAMPIIKMALALGLYPSLLYFATPTNPR